MPVSKTDISKAEEFPALETLKTTRSTMSTERSPSALSSVSTTSIGAFPSARTKVTKLEKGTYFNPTEIWVRPFLSCRCDLCRERGNGYPREEEWERCHKVHFHCEAFTIDVSKSKVVHHRTAKGHEKFSVAYVFGKSGNAEIRGWVRSKNLKRRAAVRDENTLQRGHYITGRSAAEVDRSRSPSVCSSASSMLPPALYQFGELVLCRIPSGEWVRGEVQSEFPLEILTAGENRPRRFTFHNVKKYPVRKFVALEALEVRTCAANDNWGSKCTLKRGTSIDVAYIQGYEGRITAPVAGWITVRNEHCLSVIEKDYVFSPRLPTLLINNIPASTTEVQLTRMMQHNAYVTPTSIQFQQNGDQFRAVVQFRSRAAALGLVKLGEVCLDGKHTLTFKWEMNYLRSKAAESRETRM